MEFNDHNFFKAIDKRTGGDFAKFLEEAFKLSCFLDWNASYFDHGERYDILKDPVTLMILTDGYDSTALHFDAKDKTFKTYNADANDLMEWIASEKEADPKDFEDFRVAGIYKCVDYMQRFLKEFEEDDGR